MKHQQRSIVWGVLILVTVLWLAGCSPQDAADQVAGGRGGPVPLVVQWPVEGAPGAIAVAPGGEVYVTINNSHRVVQYSPRGEILSEWEVSCRECGVIETNGITVGPDGSVYVTINNSHRVVQYSPAGEYLQEWAYQGDAVGIAAGPQGLVYLADRAGDRVLAFQTRP
jgi:DNA-binding beta-propeller fold protein YncE